MAGCGVVAWWRRGALGSQRLTSPDATAVASVRRRQWPSATSRLDFPMLRPRGNLVAACPNGARAMRAMGWGCASLVVPDWSMRDFLLALFSSRIWKLQVTIHKNPRSFRSGALICGMDVRYSTVRCADSLGGLPPHPHLVGFLLLGNVYQIWAYPQRPTPISPLSSTMLHSDEGWCGYTCRCK